MKKMFYFLGVCVGSVCFLMIFNFLTGPIVKTNTLQFFTQMFLIVLTMVLSVAMFIHGAEVKE